MLPACGGNTSSTAVTPAAQAVCPGTVSETVGSACAVEGLACFPEYSCGLAAAIATCRCSGGRFTCSDLLDASLTADATPRCPAALPNPPACPASLSGAAFTGCGDPGQLCTYPSPCESIPAYAMCQCVQAPAPDGGIYFRYECPELCDETDGGSASMEASSDAASGVPETGVSASDGSTHDSAVEAGAAASDSASEAMNDGGTESGPPSDATSD